MIRDKPLGPWQVTDETAQHWWELYPSIKEEHIACDWCVHFGKWPNGDGHCKNPRMMTRNTIDKDNRNMHPVPAWCPIGMGSLKK
jgi:hypothetical protein